MVAPRADGESWRNNRDLHHARKMKTGYIPGIGILSCCLHEEKIQPRSITGFIVRGTVLVMVRGRISGMLIVIVKGVPG